MTWHLGCPLTRMVYPNLEVKQAEGQVAMFSELCSSCV